MMPDVVRTASYAVVRLAAYRDRQKLVDVYYCLDPSGLYRRQSLLVDRNKLVVSDQISRALSNSQQDSHGSYAIILHTPTFIGGTNIVVQYDLEELLITSFNTRNSVSSRITMFALSVSKYKMSGKKSSRRG